uniref:Transmembrane protein n=1 Tax=Musa acuminata subsp. malaccensis TaxID=214687 RepID=A0A804HMP5_MUSAM|nr:PREDICTED: ABC transporter F family member 4-like [Musa acuminata subsp. malaccensis]
MEAAGVGAGKEEKRRRKKPWVKIEVTGGGGILILGSVLIAAAVGAGTAFVARRAQRRRSSTTAKPADDEENDSASKPLTSKNPDVGGTEDTILEDDTHNDGCGSIEQTLEESEFVLVNGTGEGSELILEKPDVVGEEISSTEPRLDVSQQPTEQPLHESEITFAHEEEDDDGVSSMESKYGMNYHQVEFAHDDEEKEDEAPLKEGAQLNMTELDEASTDSQFDQVIGEDEPDSVLAEKIRGEVEALLTESRIETTEFSAVKEIDEQEEEEEASSTAIIEETKPQLEMSQQQTEQAMDEPKIVLVVHEEIEDKKAMSSESESESGMNDHQTELAYDNEAKEENESGLHQTQPGMNECYSDDVRGESMLQQIYKGSELSTMKDINEMEEVSSTGSQDIAGSSAEEAEMREEGSDSTGVSSTESNADAIWPTEVIEQEKILQAVEVVADTGDQSETSAETKNMIHVEEAEEEQQKEIILVKQVTVDNVMATELTTDKEKLPIMDWFSMNSPTRLFLLLVVMALFLGFLSFIDHFIKLSYRLYQILSPARENRQEL